MTILQEIKQCIEVHWDDTKKYIIYPFGELGMQFKNILLELYDREVEIIIDNHLSKYNRKIKPLEYLETINCEDYILILANKNPKIYHELKENVKKYFKKESIAELKFMKESFSGGAIQEKTIIGKYSHGPLCGHWLVESVGAFCSFAGGCDVVQNHAIDYISTHPFLYCNNEINSVIKMGYNAYKYEPWYFEGVNPKGIIQKCRKIKIGNDVWLGRNVIITNGANIGNGVIAGAGAVITKDVPDYAVVVGVPARIIRYRYTPEQITALNKIQWWNWSDEQIRERYDDFYLPIEEFIQKYRRKVKEI